MDKKTNVISKKIARLRGWIQAAATLLTNIHIPNLFKGRIYQGNAKTVCVPGLNVIPVLRQQVPVQSELFRQS